MRMLLDLIGATGGGGFTVQDLIRIITDTGLVGFMLIALFGGYKKWWVFGWSYKESEKRAEKLEKERDDWRDIALHGTALAEQTVDLFKRSRET